MEIAKDSGLCKTEIWDEAAVFIVWPLQLLVYPFVYFSLGSRTVTASSRRGQVRSHVNLVRACHAADTLEQLIR